MALLLAVGCCIAIGGSAVPALVRAQPATIQSEGEAVRRVAVTLHKSRTFRIDRPFASAVVGAPEIADVIPMSDRSIYIQGKKVGTTNVSIFDPNMRMIAVMDVEVAPDTSDLQHKIQAAAGPGIRVSSSNEQIVLSGVAPSAVAADRAVSIAKSLVPENGSVVNAMTVAPSQQVMLKVRFLEASRSASRELGLNWFIANKSGTRGGTIGTALPVSGTAGGGVPVFQSVGALLSGSQPFGVALANVVNNGTTVDLLVNALEQKGLIRRLAEPDLVALSGDTAAFLAGGEFPVPVVQPGSGGGNTATVTIEFKPFGVQLTFNPTVLANGIINLRLAPSVSELDFANAVLISGTQVPSLLKREARTTIELRDGQSFAIAGLLQSHNRRNISQLPWIGSVPVLGALFRSSEFQNDETDLVVIVTPHLVAPAAPGQALASPLDKNIPTNDVDFFLLGQMERRKEYRAYVTAGGGLQGPYGHLIRPEPAAAVAPAGPPLVINK